MRSLYLNLRLLLAYAIWFKVFLGGQDAANPDWWAIIGAGIPVLVWTFRCNSEDLKP